MKKHSYFLIILVSCLFCNSVMACMFMSKTNYQHDIVIDEADNIVLAKAVSYEPKTHRNRKVTGFINFKTIEILKGASSNKFHIKAQETRLGSLILTSLLKYTLWFNYLNHNHKEFWEEYTGRTINHDTMCTLIPNFSIDSTYLIITGKKQDSKDYELITFKSDKWLKYVRSRLKEK